MKPALLLITPEAENEPSRCATSSCSSSEGLWLSEKRKVYGHLGGYCAEVVAYPANAISA